MCIGCRCYTAGIVPWSPSKGQYQEGGAGTALLGNSPDYHEHASQSMSRERDVRKAKRPTPGFGKQFLWCLSRVALQRTREPLTVFTDYAIFALTGETGSSTLPWPIDFVYVAARVCCSELPCIL